MLPFLSALFVQALIAIAFASADSQMNTAQRVNILLFSLFVRLKHSAPTDRGRRPILDGPLSFHAMLQAEPAFARFLFQSLPG